MTKRQIIDEIITINQSAKPEFLAEFEDTELDRYLEHLQVIGTPRLSGDPHRFDKYFEDLPTIPAPQRTEAVAVLEDDDLPDLIPEDFPEQDQAPSQDAEPAPDHRAGGRPPFAKWRAESGSKIS